MSRLQSNAEEEEEEDASRYQENMARHIHESPGQTLARF